MYIVETLLSRIRSISRHPVTKLWIQWTAVSFLILIFFRLLFFIHFSNEIFSAATEEIGDGSMLHFGLAWSQFFLGLRFDLATVPFLVMPYLLLRTIFMGNSIRAIRLARFFLFLQILWLGALITILAVSIFNFAINVKHLDWEFYSYIRDLDMLLISLYQESFLTGFSFTLIFPFFILLALLIAFQTSVISLPLQPVYSRPFQKVGQVTILLVIGIISARGGLQENPLRTADAMYGTSPYVNNVPLNSIFTILQARADTGEFHRVYDEADNIDMTRYIIGNQYDFLSDDYPLVRYMEPRRLVSERFETRPGSADNPPNIVLIIMESFTPKFLEHHGGPSDVAPRMNQLIKNGYYFERFISTGGRSANAIVAMFTGLPDRAGRTLLRSPQIQNRFGGLGTLLHKQGYSSSFVHGGDLRFDNLNRAMPHFGIEIPIGKDEMDEMGRFDLENVWGYHDGDAFEVFLETIDSQAEQGPFFGAIFTTNSHYPYEVPGPEWEYFDRSVSESAFLNSYRYADHVMGEFMDEVSTRDYFDNTVFLIVADHTHHTNLNYLEDREVPLLIYAPALIEPDVNPYLAGMVDVFPTILSLAGGNVPYASMGRDLTAPEEQDADYAFFAAGSGTDVIGWMQNDLMAVRWLRGGEPLLVTARHPASMENLLADHPETGQRYLEKAMHYHQFARMLEQENRVWPSEKELQEILAEVN